MSIKTFLVHHKILNKSNNFCNVSKYFQPCAGLLFGKENTIFHPYETKELRNQLILAMQTLINQSANFQLICKNHYILYFPLHNWSKKAYANQRTISAIIKVGCRHSKSVIITKQRFDEITNPGPQVIENRKIDIYTLNCRGLGKIEKFSLILSKVAQLISLNHNSIFMLQ